MRAATRPCAQWLIAFWVCLAPLAASAQTRAALLDEQRTERTRALEAQSPSIVDQALVFVEQHRLVDRFSPERGFYPKVGSITTGGGLAVGGGYRRGFVNDEIFLNGTALATLKGYRLGRVDLALPRLLRHTLEVTGYARSAHYPEEEFFGLGPASRESDRTNFLLDEIECAGQVAWRPRRWLRLAVQEAWRRPRTGGGQDSRHPSSDARFGDASAPGLTRATDFVEFGGLTEVSSLDQSSNPHRGGRYVAYAAMFDDRHDRGFDFSRVAGHVEQYVPVFDRKRVVVVRAAANHLRAALGSRVPFYYMTPLGGRDSIRGFDDLRFRDANAWLVNGEYRWEAHSGVDLAIFYDRGSVAPTWRELSWHGARESYGFGVRVGTPRSVVMRAEVAFGSREGLNYYVAMGAPLRMERYFR